MEDLHSKKKEKKDEGMESLEIPKTTAMQHYRKKKRRQKNMKRFTKITGKQSVRRYGTYACACMPAAADDDGIPCHAKKKEACILIMQYSHT